MPLVTPFCSSQLARLTVVEMLAEGRCAGVSSPLDRQMGLFTLPRCAYPFLSQSIMPITNGCIGAFADGILV